VIREIHCVGEENPADGDTARVITVAPTRDAKGVSAWRNGRLGQAEPVPGAGPPVSARCLEARPRTNAPHLNPMSESDDRAQLATGTTEINLVTGARHRVAGNAKDVERTILDAARGSIMQLAWLVDADTGADLAVNPVHVVLLRAAAPETAA
jgi:hypothetical protein